MSEFQLIGLILMVVGALLILIAGVGILRLPDLYMRMSATTKAATLGLGMMLIGLAIMDGSLAVAGRAALTIIFLLLTAPIAAHAIGQAAYFSGVPLWQGTVLEELKRQPAHKPVDAPPASITNSEQRSRAD